MQVTFFKGDYKARQMKANEAGVDAYFEHHFNAGSRSANYAVGIVATNHSKRSYELARQYAKEVAKEFNIHVARDTDRDPSNDGVFVGGWDGRRGNHNLKYTAMPAVLLEPLFASNPTHAQWIRSESGQRRLSACLARTIYAFYPHDAHIGLSVGHKYKTSKPNDRGVEVYGGGSEAEYAEVVLKLTQELLVNTVVPSPAEVHFITYEVQRGDTLFKIAEATNTSVSRLAEVNKIKNPDRLVLGQKIQVPRCRQVYL